MRWKQIEDLPYFVSDTGLVKNSYGKLMKQQLNDKGYFRASIIIDYKQVWVKVQRLVATAFVPNPFCLPETNHKDANKRNNAYTNLEWCTHAYNIAHSVKIGKHPKGETNGSAKLTDGKIRQIRKLYLYTGITQTELGKQFGVDPSVICEIVNRKAWKHVE